MKPITVLVVCSVFSSAVFAQVPRRIRQPIDDTRLVRIPGSTHRPANSAAEAGRVPSNLPLERMLLALKSSPEQQAALDQLLAEQQDPQSPNYQRWLTPEEFADRFGVSPDDLAAISNWLASHGLRVNQVSRGGRSIEFSATAGQVEEAFQTEFHHYLVNGVRHLANSTDIAIPEALAGIVDGVVSLHDFHARPMHHLVPLTNLNGGSHGLSPYDFSVIYDVAPLWNQGLDGSGQTIAIVADTNVKVSDDTTFRSSFGLSANNVQVVVNGANPGIVSGEETEADLDLQWAGGVAKGATIKLVVSANTATSDGITLSAEYIVQNNLAPVMTVSYGLCEAQLGSGNTFYGNLWAQAAAQGISVFVASGDSGSAGCDPAQSGSSSGKNTTTPASYGFAVNGLASSPYNVAVGGTQFNDASGSYWNTANNSQMASARGYIPEAVWNQSSYTTSGASGNGLWAGGGGVSTVWATPSWQTGPGVPTVDPGTASGHHRYLPDVSLSASGHDGYLVYIEGGLYLVGGTSAATPSMAGIMAILIQRAGGVRQGNSNLRLYPIAAQSPSAFHDTTSGTNAVPCKGGSPNCSSTSPATPGVLKGYSAAAGFDLATGWGSVDANALATAWGAAPAAVTITSLSPSPMVASSANQILTINGSGFVSGATVKFTYAGGPVQTLNPTFVSSSKLTASVNVGTAARTWTVQVFNSTSTASNIVNLPVTAPAAAPAILSVSPSPMKAANSVQTLVINGSGFQSGLKVNLTKSNSTTTYSGNSIAGVGAAQVIVLVNVGATAATWTVQIVNADGQLSNSVSLPVIVPSPAPAVTSMTPNPMPSSVSNQTLTLNGSGFQAGIKLLMEPVGSTAVTTWSGSAVTVVSATQIKVTVNVGAVKRNWYLQLQNPDGQYSNLMVLQVN